MSFAIQDHSVTCHTTQVNTPHLNPSRTSRYSIYQPRKDGGLSKPRPRVQTATGPRLLRERLQPAGLEPRPHDCQSSTLTTIGYCVTQRATGEEGTKLANQLKMSQTGLEIKRKAAVDATSQTCVKDV